MPHPSFMVFDLDPGEPATMVQCCQVGLWVREMMEGAGLRSFAKTSGSKGLQVYVPLNSGLGYSETKRFAHELALTLERRHPGEVVSDMKKALRHGKVLVDWSQNDIHKTTVCVYSLRARQQPTVSTPVTWEEVGRCLRSRNPAALTFTASQVLQRVERHGDLFAPVLKLRQSLPANVLDEAAHAGRKPVPASKASRKSAHSPAAARSRIKRAG